MSTEEVDNINAIKINDADSFVINKTLINYFFKIVKEGNLDLIKNELVKLNCEISILEDDNEQNVLTFAALINDDNQSLEVMKYFIDELNVDLSWEDKFYQTPLFYSVRQGLYYTTKFLIDKGADVNHLDKHKQTPLFYAAREGHLEISQLLIENNADLNLEDYLHQTPIYYAIKNSRFNIVRYFINNLQYIGLNKMDKKGLTPFAFAKKSGEFEIAHLLSQKGANPEIGISEKIFTKKKLLPTIDQCKDNIEINGFVFVKYVNDEELILTESEIDNLLKGHFLINELVNEE